MSFPKTFAFLLCLVLLPLGVACKRQPSNSGGVSAPQASAEGKELSLKQGLEISLSQQRLVENGVLNSGSGPWTRKLEIINPSGAEGLSFTWQLQAEAESQPSAGSPAGKMTLANTVDTRRMTLPLFWPGGELYMSNSSALWLSDRAFRELKKDGETQYDLGLVENPILGPAQGLTMLEKTLAALGQSFAAQPEKKTTTLLWKIRDKSLDFPLKVNGALTEVEAFEAESPMARIKVLDNAQNPLVLQVQIAPLASAAQAIFFPLSWMGGLLDYKVEALDLPAR